MIISKTMSVPIHIHTDSILKKCQEIQKGVLLIIAPTGSGKTMGMRDLISQHKNVYGSTIMVQPTKMATHSVKGVNTMTPSRLIKGFLQKKKFDCDTLVIDEAHTISVEYHTIFSILEKTECYNKIRVVLMSATPHVEELEKFFPLHVYTVPVSSPFPIMIKYEPYLQFGFANYKQMVAHVVHLLKKYPHHKKVLVFLYTHDQCEKMSLEMKKNAQLYNQGETFALYGGMDKNDMQQWHEFLEKEEKFIIFSTNVAETSITIPNLSLIIDFGIRCIQRNHRIVYNYCPKSNLVQRSGRTGRTCPGVVIRCMSEDDFNHLPNTDTMEYNWDMMVLLMLRYKYNPVLLLPDDAPITNILQKFRFYRLLDNDGGLDHQLTFFVLNSPLLLKNSCHLYYFLKTNMNNHLLGLYTLSCGLIDHIESRMSRIYYFSNDMRFSRLTLIQKLRKIFIADGHDELVLHMNIVVSCMLNEKPVDFANAFSLNFRSVRHIASTTTRLWGFINQYKGRKTVETWQDAVRNKFQTHTVCGLIKNNDPFLIQKLNGRFADHLRHCYMINPITPKFIFVNDILMRPNLVVESHNCLISPYIQSKYKCYLLLSFDDTDVYKWFDPLNTLDNITVLSFSLYTHLPSSMDTFIHNINTTIKMGCFNMNYLRKQKAHVKNKFQHVVKDIQEDVAYRPGFWKMHQSIQEFTSYFEKINKMLLINR